VKKWEMEVLFLLADIISRAESLLVEHGIMQGVEWQLIKASFYPSLVLGTQFRQPAFHHSGLRRRITLTRSMA
jgi:hypothetical protein